MVMKRESMRALHAAANGTVDRMVSWLVQLPTIDAAALNEKDTVFFVIDVINDFAEEGGVLYDPRVKGIVPNVAKLLRKFPEAERYFFNDAHNDASVEFGAYPAHAIDGTWGAQVVDELREFITADNVIKKNSTNGMLATVDGKVALEALRSKYLGALELPAFIFVGDVTDICVLQAALTFRAYLNQWSADARIILPVDCVETFDLDATNHDADIMNLFALYNMNMNGIEVVAGIK